MSQPATAPFADEYGWYFAALRGEHPPIHDGEPESGFYRIKWGKSGKLLPVAIWRDDGQVLARVGDRMAQHPDEIWLGCARAPITEEVYRAVLAGQPWPDEPPAPAGHNEPPVSDDPREQIAHEFSSEAEIAGPFLRTPIETADQADQAGVWADRLTKLARRAEEHHKVEKRPHLDAGRAVDDRWRDVITDIRELATKLKRHVEPFLVAQKRAEEERARKAREEADRLAREAAEAARKAKAANDQEAAEKARELQRQAAEADKASIVKNASAGRTGARVSVRTEKRAKIVDYAACLQALSDHPDVKALVEQLAQRAVRAGMPLAGVEVIETEKVV